MLGNSAERPQNPLSKLKYLIGDEAARDLHILIHLF